MYDCNFRKLFNFMKKKEMNVIKCTRKKFIIFYKNNLSMR